MDRRCLKLTEEELQALLAQGWIKEGGPFSTEQTCLTNCGGSSSSSSSSFDGITCEYCEYPASFEEATNFPETIDLVVDGSGVCSGLFTLTKTNVGGEAQWIFTNSVDPLTVGCLDPEAVTADIEYTLACVDSQVILIIKVISDAGSILNCQMYIPLTGTCCPSIELTGTAANAIDCALCSDCNECCGEELTTVTLTGTCTQPGCCNGLVDIPDDLFLTLSNAGGCDCLDSLTVPLTRSGSTWTGVAFVFCVDFVALTFTFECSAEITNWFQVTISGCPSTGDQIFGDTAPTTCNPFLWEFAGANITGCCEGTVNITITE